MSSCRATNANLRPYQQRAIADLRSSYQAGRRAPCLVLPTGAGKTVVASAVIRSATERGKRVLFLAHRAELLDQSVAKLEASGVTNVRLIRAEHDLGNPLAPVVVASVQTLSTPRWANRMPKADLVVFDECHHVKARTWTTIADQYASAHLLGMTATPQRGDGAPLGDIFDALVVGSTVKELTQLGHLVPCRVWAPPAALDSDQLALSVADAYLKHAQGERAVVFCATVEHAERVAAELVDAGVPTGVVSGMGGGRADTLKRFRAGELRAVCNVHVLTEGWDDPGAAVCILARKPQHAGTFLQMAGRVLRPSQGKHDALLLDLCGSVHEHGTPDMDREYALDGKAIRAADREPIRQCPTCGSVFLAAGVDGACPQCGASLPRMERKLPGSIGVGLSELPSLPPRPMRPREIVSKYPGRCARCMKPYSAGDSILWAKDQKPTHAVCDRDAENAAIDALLRGVA